MNVFISFSSSTFKVLKFKIFHYNCFPENEVLNEKIQLCVNQEPENFGIHLTLSQIVGPYVYQGVNSLKFVFPTSNIFYLGLIRIQISRELCSTFLLRYFDDFMLMMTTNKHKTCNTGSFLGMVTIFFSPLNSQCLKYTRSS